MVSDQVTAVSGQDAWVRALRRAAARGYVIELVRECQHTHGPVKVFKIASHSEPGAWRSVMVSRVGSGFAINCDCPAGERSVPCVHAAVVLREIGILQQPEPLLVPVA